MKYDEYLSPEDIRIMNLLKKSNRMEQDQILWEEEKKKCQVLKVVSPHT